MDLKRPQCQHSCRGKGYVADMEGGVDEGLGGGLKGSTTGGRYLGGPVARARCSWAQETSMKIVCLEVVVGMDMDKAA